VYIILIYKIKNHLFLNKEETLSKIADRRKQNEIFTKSTIVPKKKVP